MAEEKREVNFSEVVKIDEPIEEGKEIETSEEEKETQEESSPQKNQEESEELEESDVESEESEETDETSDVPKEPKPVEGETPREKALRLETQRLRRDLRDTRNQKIFENYSPEAKAELSKEEQEFLSQYDKTELGQFEKIIDVIAKQKGWAKNADIQKQSYQQQASDVLDGWLDNHKEYLPENDKDNTLWNQFQRELSLYRKPENPRDLRRIFDKVHREVFGVSEGTNNSKINAQKEKVKLASHSGANRKSQIVQRENSSTDPALREHLKGFSEEEKDEIIG